jgi:superfamily II DNA or RNA helicase
LCEKVRELHPEWSFGGFPQMTFHLATGVGKTRLMGAIAAYLYLGDQASNFLFLAPRAAILRKLKDESYSGSPKYLFVDPSLVPEPHLWHSDNVESFKVDPPQELFGRGPHLFVFSPQGITGDDRRVFRPSEFSGTSPGEYLSHAQDLVVFLDESHHVRRMAEAETRAWTQAIRELAPKVLFGMTATPPKEMGVNVLHEYDLASCLREKLYTKDVEIIVHQRPAAVTSDDDWDHHTLDFALDRLVRKEQVIKDYQGNLPFLKVRPVVLVCAVDTAHADAVAAWLQRDRGLSSEEILVTHSGRAKTEDEIARLVGIERPNSRVRVIVNVYELTEGWDVTNVYVIAPLRAMGTFEGAVQTLGRGLRLPAGRRIGNDDLDTLDVLCFGREALSDILQIAKQNFGEDDEEMVVSVRERTDEDTGSSPPTKEITIKSARPAMIEIPRVIRHPIEPDLEFAVHTQRRVSHHSAARFRLGEDDVSSTIESLKYEFDVAVRLAGGRILSDLSYLSEPLHRAKVEALVAQFLVSLGQKKDGPVAFDWLLIAEAIKEEIDQPYRRKTAAFEAIPPAERIDFGDYSWRVPETFGDAVPRRSPPWWDPTLRRIPISGWKRCVHEAVAFESLPEYQVAEVLDSASEVEWWVRNDPPRLRIPTPIGYFEPDFVAFRCKDGRRSLIVIEVKRVDLWDGPESDARVKSRATTGWCAAINGMKSEEYWLHWVILDVDAQNAHTIDDLERLRVQDAPPPT